MSRQKIEFMDTVLVTADINREHRIGIRFLFIAVVVREQFMGGFLVGSQYVEKARYFYDVRFN